MSYTYREHRKKLLRDKEVREACENLLPEYELAKSIIEQRLKKKMTQEDIAVKAGIPQSTVSRIERLTHGLPKLSTLKKIAEALDAKIIIRFEAKKAPRPYIVDTKHEKLFAINEAKRHYGKRTRS
ncbi:MAG: helix-turn-helix transcriptional regulator [Nitrospirae bacterium]|nr:helix-turn-helix transcriptional regulator [Nitrospirota bacterium]